MRPVSTRFKTEFSKWSTDECQLWIVEISHPTLLTTPVRITDNTEWVVHKGNTYYSYPFTIEYPDDGENIIGSGVLACDNIDQDIYVVLANLDDRTEIRLGLVTGGQQDVNELANNQRLVKFNCPGFTCTEDTLSATISRAIDSDAPFPGLWITRQYFPFSP